VVGFSSVGQNIAYDYGTNAIDKDLKTMFQKWSDEVVKKNYELINKNIIFKTKQGLGTCGAYSF